MANLIKISAGKVTCVYDDRFRPLLEALGMMSIERASEVEFNPQTAEWEASLTLPLGEGIGQVIAHGPNRNEVIKAEVKWLEENL